MKLNKRKLIRCVTDNILVFVVFFGVFTLTFYANVISVDFGVGGYGGEEQRTVKRKNGKNSVSLVRFFDKSETCTL